MLFTLCYDSGSMWSLPNEVTFGRCVGKISRISSAAPRFGRRNQTNVTLAHQAPSSGAPEERSPAVCLCAAPLVIPRHSPSRSHGKNNLKTAHTNQSQKYCPSTTIRQWHQLLTKETVCNTWRNWSTSAFLIHTVNSTVILSKSKVCKGQDVQFGGLSSGSPQK